MDYGEKSMKFLCRLIGHRWAETGFNRSFMCVEKTCARCKKQMHWTGSFKGRLFAEGPAKRIKP